MSSSSTDCSCRSINPLGPPAACSRPGGRPARAAGAAPPRSAPEPARPGRRAPLRRLGPSRRDWFACCMKAIAPKPERSVPGRDSLSARRTRSISSTRSYRVRCSSSDSISCGSSRRGPPASSCSAQATRYPETDMPSAAARSLITVEPRIYGIAERLPALLQPEIGHAPFLYLGEQQKLAYSAAQNRIRQRVRHGRPVHDVAREIHARACRQFANSRPFARRGHHCVLGAALSRPAAREDTLGTRQHGMMYSTGFTLMPMPPSQIHMIRIPLLNPDMSSQITASWPPIGRISAVTSPVNTDRYPRTHAFSSPIATGPSYPPNQTSSQNRHSPLASIHNTQ